VPTINRNGVHVYYQCKGKGMPIVFIHPPLLTSSNFYYQVNELSLDYQTITFDIRGHGNSAISEEPLTFSLISQDIESILNELNIEKAFVCGYSTGGSIALDFMLTYPERAYGAILLGPMSEVDDWLLRNRIRLAVKLSKNKWMRILALAICYGNSNNMATFRHLYQEAKKGNSKNIEQYYRYSLTYNCTSRLAEICQPVLLLYGEKDKQFHRYARIISQKLPNNELIFVKKAKHQLPTKWADEVNHLIKEFIKKNCPSH
jgi:pimeloyl-ACP methyl ester carboxylesterase